MLIAFDTETELFGPGYMTPRVVCLTLAYDDPHHPALAALPQGPHHIQTRDPMTGLWWSLLDRCGIQTIWPALVRSATSGQIALVAHNAQFDLRVLGRACPDVAAETFDLIEAGGVYCTFLRERLIGLANGVLSDRRPAAIDPWSGKVGPFRAGLAACVMRYLNIDIREGKKAQPGQGEPWRLRYVELIDTPLSEWPEAAVKYAVDDALYVHRVIRAQEKTHPQQVDGWNTRQTPAAGWRPSRLGGEHFEVNGIGGGEVRAHFALTLMGAWGLRTDPDAVANTIADWTRHSEAGLEIARDIGFVVAKGKRNMARLRHAVSVGYGATETPCAACEGRGWNPPTGRQRKNQTCKPCKGVGAFATGGNAPLTDSGAVSTSEAALRGVRHHDALKAYADSLKATNWLNKYGPVLLRGTAVPVTYEVKSMVSTGRTAVSKPPMQQPPRGHKAIAGFRECFVPRPGMLYAGADYDQIELRTLAQMHIWWGLGDTMAQAFRDGLDPHLLMGVNILNAEGHNAPLPGEWTYNLALECRQGQHGGEWKDVVKNYRQMAKAANFGFPGGLGVGTFIDYAAAAYKVELDEEATKALKDTWLATWPEMPGYFERINDSLGFGESFTAQQAVSWRIRGGCGYCDGANTYFQGLAADGFKAAGWWLQRECFARPDSPLYGSRIVLPLHDEYIAEVPEGKAPEAAERLAEIMCDAMQAFLPDVPVSTEPVLMRRWYKDAETVRDNDGRLMPWEPK